MLTRWLAGFNLTRKTNILGILSCTAYAVGAAWYLSKTAPAVWGLVASLAFIIGHKIPVIGITGGIASGKTTASTHIRDSLGYVLIDADKVAREIVEKGTSGYKSIVRTFGPSIINLNTGEIDRKTLGAIVFANRDLRKKLESITHPRILGRMIFEILKQRLVHGKKVLIDVPLLFESRTPILYWLCRETFTVDLDTAKQEERLSVRNPEMTKLDIQNRVRSQMPREEKKKFADFVLDNSSSKEELFTQLDYFFS